MDKKSKAEVIHEVETCGMTLKDRTDATADLLKRLAEPQTHLEHWVVDLGIWRRSLLDLHMPARITRFRIVRTTEVTPTYRPWKPEEVPVGSVVVSRATGARRLIVGCAAQVVHMGMTIVSTPDRMLMDYTMADGSPCGVLEETEA